MNDLTASAIDRQNILNNPLAVEEIQEYIGITGMLFEGGYRYTANLVADFYEIDIRTVRRYVDEHNSELRNNGYQVLKGQKLKQFKATFAHVLQQYEQEQLKDIDVTQLTELPDFQFGTRSKSLGIFNFRAFLNVGMLLVESEKARNVMAIKFTGAEGKLFPDTLHLKSMKLILPLLISITASLAPAYSQQKAPPAEHPRGKLIDVGGYKLHLCCTGPDTAKLTVVFESGAGGSSKDWSRVLQLLPREVRACAYDRAGSGWSENGPEPRTMHQEVFELNALLHAANVTGPFILVGQSMGGLLVRLYAEHYDSDVAGMVLVDPTHESSMLGSMRYGGWVRLREKATGQPIPEPRLGKERDVRYNPDADYMAEEFQQIYLSRQRNPVPLQHRPLIVLAAGKRPQPPGTPDSLWKEIRHERDSLLRDLAHLSENSKFVLDPSSGHAMHYDSPGLVARAISEVIQAVVTKSKLEHE